MDWNLINLVIYYVFSLTRVYLCQSHMSAADDIFWCLSSWNISIAFNLAIPERISVKV